MSLLLRTLVAVIVVVVVTSFSPSRTHGTACLSRATPAHLPRSYFWRRQKMHSTPTDDDDLYQSKLQTMQEEEDRSRLTSTGEAVAAGGIAVALALVLGVEILDAGAVSSAILVGAGAAWLAENEDKYGIGMVARGLGKIGKFVVDAAVSTNDKLEVGKNLGSAFSSAAEKADRITERTKQKLSEQEE